jgi:alkaline phosphatase
MINTRYKTVLFIFVLILSGTEWQNASVPGNRNEKVKNIILFIGDGMGVAQLYAGMTVSDKPFFLERFPYAGYSKTTASDKYITDSAAGGTAIATGTKTRNGMIGMGPDSLRVASIMEIARKNGLATGVVSTKAITDATPASFVSHNSGRGNYEEIAEDFLNGTLDLFVGGGSDHFRKRKDGRDLTVRLREMGYDVVYSLEELDKSNSSKIAGLLAGVNMPKVVDGRAGSLEKITRKAISTLSKNKNGFILMVEGGMIDSGGHSNDIDFVVSEMIDLDNAIGVALEFAEKNRETLIVTTADHETGGLTLTRGNLNEHKVTADFSTSDHTAVMVPIFSYGPCAERFSGIHENTFFLDEFVKSLRIKR